MLHLLLMVLKIASLICFQVDSEATRRSQVWINAEHQRECRHVCTTSKAAEKQTAVEA
jgi:hypothetical protein